MSATASKPTNYASQAPITITPAAALRSFEIIREAENPDLKIRVSILGGGCHGFGYDVNFADSIEDDDILITKAVEYDGTTQTVDWVVGAVSLQLLHGVEIDHEFNLQGEHFIFRNLKVKTTCSCGRSFSIADADSTADAD